MGALSSPRNPEIDDERSHDDDQTVEEIVYVDDEDGSYFEEVIDEEDGSYIEEIIEEVTVTEVDLDDEKSDEIQHEDDDTNFTGIDREGGKNVADETKEGDGEGDGDGSSSAPGYDDDSSAAALSADTDTPAFDEELGRSFREDAGVDLLTKRREKIQQEMQKAAMSEGARKAMEEELAREKMRARQVSQETPRENEQEHLDEDGCSTNTNDNIESTRRKQREALLRQKQQDEAARRRLEEEIRKVDIALARKRETAAQTRIQGEAQVENRRKALAELRRQSAREELARSNEALKAEREARGLSNISTKVPISMEANASHSIEEKDPSEINTQGQGVAHSIESPNGTTLLSPLLTDLETANSGNIKASINATTKETPLVANTRKRGTHVESEVQSQSRVALEGQAPAVDASGNVDANKEGVMYYGEGSSSARDYSRDVNANESLLDDGDSVGQTGENPGEATDIYSTEDREIEKERNDKRHQSVEEKCSLESHRGVEEQNRDAEHQDSCVVREGNSVEENQDNGNDELEMEKPNCVVEQELPTKEQTEEGNDAATKQTMLHLEDEANSPSKRALEERVKRDIEMKLAEEARLAEENAAEEPMIKANGEEIAEKQTVSEAITDEEKHKAEREAVEQADLKKEEDRQKASETARLAEEQAAAEAKAMEENRIAEKKAADEAKMKAEEEARQKAAETARLAEEQAAAEAKAMEEKRISEQKAADEARLKAEEERNRRVAEEQKIAEEKRRQEVEEARRKAAEEVKVTEENRLKEVEEARRKAAEEAKVAEQKRLKEADEARWKVAEEGKVAEQKKLKEAEETRRKAAEEANVAEKKNRDEENSRKAEEETRISEEEQRLPQHSKIENDTRLKKQEQEQVASDSNFPKSPVLAARKKFENPKMALPAAFDPKSPIGQARRKFETSLQPVTTSPLPIKGGVPRKKKLGDDQASDVRAAFKVKIKKEPTNSSVPAAFRTTKVSTSNTKAPVSSPAVPKTTPPSTTKDDGKFYSIDDLRARKIEGLDYTSREQYLSPNDFQQYFQMTKEEFSKLPKWKRDKAKRSLKLF